MARKATVREAALNTLFESRRPLTAKEMNVSAVIAGRLRDQGYTVHVDVLRKPERGRPAFRYTLSDETRNEVRKARRRTQRNSAKVTA
jgi:hypothetical protein